MKVFILAICSVNSLLRIILSTNVNQKRIRQIFQYSFLLCCKIVILRNALLSKILVKRCPGWSVKCIFKNVSLLQCQKLIYYCLLASL